MSAPALPDLLVRWRGDLLRFVERNGGDVLRQETAEDLVQGIHVRALASEGTFVWEGERPFLAWLHALARTHLADRHDHWTAAKRNAGRLLRLTDDPSLSGDPRAVATPRSPGRGPVTAASEAEDVRTAVQALSLLGARDRDLVTWECEGVPVAEQATRLGVTYEAAQRARLRALERYRKTFRALSGRR